ncbi:NAD(P)-dependent alcohol dehydrogenase [Bradyrhizobium sp. 62B]|uniref:NAD(P)-dependent alcohol dehydrogenase n=1 Tax=Bradyrhizobium sp. 62B TaxID=2898442 RepID=UPI00255808D2|nr:NAD(P)-dependent alcohol dehydrogenase [Bradyrhizobium sp. 62B]
MKISAAVARAPAAPMSLETLDLAPPRADEILVKLVATGICHTDIAMRDQAYPVPQPIVLGHEGAGIVAGVGSAVTKVKPGDRVVMTFNSCGHCASCAEHIPSYCYNFFEHNFAGQRPDGSSALSTGSERIHGNFFGQSSFASHAVCHERNIVKVTDNVPLELLGPLACGIQTGAGAIINALKVGMGQSLAVIGSGSVGLSAIMAARLVGAGTIIAVDLNEARLALARELGATHVINARTGNVVEEIRKITGGAGTDYTFETTGVLTVLRQAIDALAPRGTCGFVGASPAGSEVAVNVTDIMTAGRKIHGIVEGESNPDVFIPRMIELYKQGRFPFDKLISFYPFEKINDAIHDAEHGKALKPVVRFPQ